MLLLALRLLLVTVALTWVLAGGPDDLADECPRVTACPRHLNGFLDGTLGNGARHDCVPKSRVCHRITLVALGWLLLLEPSVQFVCMVKDVLP